MTPSSRLTLGSLVAGLLLGSSLSMIGFSSWDEVHAMFTFSELRLVLAFAFGVALLLPSWLLIARLTGASWSPRKIHRGTLIGGALFGVGWALSGACPSIALVQLGEGQLAALYTLGGILLGNWLYSVLNDRYWKLAASSCADD